MTLVSSIHFLKQKECFNVLYFTFAVNVQLAVVSKLASIQNTQKEHGEMLQLLFNVFAGGATVQTAAATNSAGSAEVGVLKITLPLATIEDLISFEKSMETLEGVKTLVS
ncbi:unnamed protein product [Orchesella dallaii]|uniref:Uncharacterized protein n=1 Tax=Orchesella dallaii TaxID=48710 RepID=A0ABP1R9J3_9HEXA